MDNNICTNSSPISTISVVRICPRCKTGKCKKDFHKSKNNPLGIQGWCKKCNSEYIKAYNRKYYGHEKWT